MIDRREHPHPTIQRRSGCECRRCPTPGLAPRPGSNHRAPMVHPVALDAGTARHSHASAGRRDPWTRGCQRGCAAASRPCDAPRRQRARLPDRRGWPPADRHRRPSASARAGQGAGAPPWRFLWPAGRRSSSGGAPALGKPVPGRRACRCPARSSGSASTDSPRSRRSTTCFFRPADQRLTSAAALGALPFALRAPSSPPSATPPTSFSFSISRSFLRHVYLTQFRVQKNCGRGSFRMLAYLLDMSRILRSVPPMSE